MRALLFVIENLNCFWASADLVIVQSNATLKRDSARVPHFNTPGCVLQMPV